MPDLNLVVLLIIAVVNLATGWLAWQTKRDIRKVEKATNSMKDALVTASFAAGRQEERDQRKRPL